MDVIVLNKNLVQNKKNKLQSYRFNIEFNDKYFLIIYSRREYLDYWLIGDGDQVKYMEFCITGTL